jgi:hypothetical protein
MPNGGAALSHQNRQARISSKVVQGKGIGPTCWFVASPEVGLGATVGTLQTGYPCAQDLKDQPHGSRSVPGARGLWLHHVPQGTEHATHQKMAMGSPHAPWHRACHPPGKGSGVTTCLEAPSAPPTRKGLWCCHVPRGTQHQSPSLGRRGLQSRHVPHGSRPAPCAGRLWRRHVTEAPRPPPGRAPISPRVLWL